MKRRLLALSAGLLLAGGLLPGPALAGGGVIDQHSETGNFDWGLGAGSYAQTFTVGMTGTLTGVSLWVYNPSERVHVDVAIHALNASGYPTGVHLSSTWAAALTIEGWVYFSMPAYDVTAGQHLAIVIQLAAYCHIRGSINNPYPGGMALDGKNGWHPLQQAMNRDFHFRTWVMPAPVILPPQGTPQPTLAPAPAASPTPSAQIEAPSTPAQTEAGPTAAAPTAAPQSAAASATATSTTGTGGSDESSGPPVLMIVAGIVVLALLGGVGCLLAFLLLRWRRRPPGEVPPPVGG